MSHQNIKTVAVIGGGTMGNGIAHVFAQFGYRVFLADVKHEIVDGALATIGGNLDRQIKKGAITESISASAAGPGLPVPPLVLAAARFTR